MIEGPHRRYNPLLEEWVLCSPHRLERPWQGQTERVAEAETAPIEETAPVEETVAPPAAPATLPSELQK